MRAILLLMATLMAGDDSPAVPALVIVAGAPGAPQYEEAFRQWADRWSSAATQAGARCLGVGAASDQTDPTNPSDKNHLQGILASEEKTSPSPLWLVLIGHGTFDGEAAKFNLRGPDLTAGELAEWLKPYQRPLVVINCASSSAPFINLLSAPGRVVITATKSGYEQNYARFGDDLSAALLDPKADLDKDGQTSLLEAFLLASARVDEFYTQEARLRTETALIDDNGDGRGTPAAWFRGIHAIRKAKEGSGLLDGARAHQFHLIPSTAEQAMPADVRARRDALELQIARLRQAKSATSDEDSHYAELEPLLVELARLYAQLERPTEEPPTSPSVP